MSSDELGFIGWVCISLGAILIAISVKVYYVSKRADREVGDTRP